jgi:hypothetical protein
VVLGLACHKNTPPSQPILYGPSVGWPRDSLLFRAVSVDADGDSLSYTFNWADGTGANWSAWFAADSECRVTHLFSDTGLYAVTVKAKDAGDESAPSDSFDVRVAEIGPDTPRKPMGKDTVAVSDSFGYTTSASHLLMKPVAFRFGWGDSVDGWSEFLRPGEMYQRRHRFSRGGTFAVRAQAKDSREHLSDWSRAETVLVEDTFRTRATRPGP